ncbi:MAG TPA: DUF2877 domain-containing protein [Candidatus Dormibacteraeota bacterium]|nr:DUF2877 domain-containing protein [Candidatus Dormibacteraeota bacterium]
MRVEASTAIAALLAGPPRSARLLGASTAAAYLAVDGIEVIAVVAAAAVRLPVAVVVPTAVPPVGDPARVLVGGGGVDLGGTWLQPESWFDPRPVLGGAPLAAHLTGARALLDRLPEGAAGLDPALAAGVAGGLRGGDAGPSLALLGRGPGLTPAGDDVVAGALAALVLLGGAVPAAAGVLEEAPRRTTLLSAALLRCAARGQVVPQAAGLLRALCGEGALQPAVEALLDIGATSGPALALGLCAGAEAALRGPAPATGGGAPAAG